MNRDKIMAALKGGTWALILLALMQMCTGCKSSKQAVLVSDQESVRVTKMQDSIDYAILARAIKNVMINVGAETSSERISYSVPDAQGRQHVTSVERSQTSSEVKFKEEEEQQMAAAYMRMQTMLDSLRERVTMVEEARGSERKREEALTIGTWVTIVTMITIGTIIGIRKRMKCKEKEYGKNE